MAKPDEQTVEETKAEAVEACTRLLGARPAQVELTGGGRLKSLRLRLQDRSVIATRRKTPQRAELEAAVLGALKKADAPVPAVLAFDGTWLIQEDLGTRRISRLLRDADVTECERLLNLALDSLARIHGIGDALGLPERLYGIGSKPGWLERLIGLPSRLGARLGVAAPNLPEAELVALLSGPQRSFVKWDARPANACLTADGSAAWFDWEHCGRRNRLDDLAWVLCDERVPDVPEMEKRLLARHLGTFDEGGYTADAASYLSAFGVFHSLIRLSVVLGSWLDKAGTPDAAPLGAGRLRDSQVLLHRAERWAEHTDATSGLVPWAQGFSAYLSDSAAK